MISVLLHGHVQLLSYELQRINVSEDSDTGLVRRKVTLGFRNEDLPGSKGRNGAHIIQAETRSPCGRADMLDGVCVVSCFLFVVVVSVSHTYKMSKKKQAPPEEEGKGK